MDGYHFVDMVLVPRGLRPRKGAPETFDVAGLHHMLLRLRRDEEAEIAVPVFDRRIEIARSVRHVIVEGNYLLLGRPGWSAFGACSTSPSWSPRPTRSYANGLSSGGSIPGFRPRRPPPRSRATTCRTGGWLQSNSLPADFVYAS